jgi:hypothetical protein
VVRTLEVDCLKIAFETIRHTVTELEPIMTWLSYVNEQKAYTKFFSSFVLRFFNILIFLLVMLDLNFAINTTLNSR